MEQLPAENIPVPFWIRDHINSQMIAGPTKDAIRETIAEWLNSGLLFIDAPGSSMPTIEQQNEPELVSRKGERLRLGEDITNRTELDQQILLRATQLDLIFYGQRLIFFGRASFDR